MITQSCKIGKRTKIWNPVLVNLYDCEIGEDCSIANFVEIGRNVRIGNNCRIQAFCFIPEGVRIEDNVFIGPNVIFTNDKYPPSGRKEWLPIIVKKGASIGARSVILPGVRIGEKAVIGAGSVVTKDIYDYMVVYGNPAREWRIEKGKK